MIISLLFSIGQFVLLDSLPLQRHDPIFSQFSQINRIQQNLWWFIGGLADWYYIENILSLNLIYFIRRFLSISHDLLCISIGFVTFKLLLISVFLGKYSSRFFFLSLLWHNSKRKTSPFSMYVWFLLNSYLHVATRRVTRIIKCILVVCPAVLLIQGAMSQQMHNRNVIWPQS